MHFEVWLSKPSFQNLALPVSLFGFLSLDINQSIDEIIGQYLNIRNFTTLKNPMQHKTP